MTDLDILQPEVRDAVRKMDFADITLAEYEAWLVIRADLLHLQGETDRLHKVACEQLRRAQKAEAELAALKARIFQGIVLDVEDLARGHAGLPSEWRGKRVRLVVEE